MLALALSLGHNSSAVLIKDGEIINGYEEERFTGIKSESRFPSSAIDACLLDISGFVDTVFITHWSTYSNYLDMNDKHFDKYKLNSILGPETTVESQDELFTHHDAHMEVARAYSGPETEYTIVADGFGNFNEVLSIYKNDKLLYRSHGYGKSIGLLYQYTTAYLGMKMNQDEYKLLGYEAHILDVLSNYPQTAGQLQIAANKISKKYLKELLDNKPGYELDSLLDTSALIKTRKEVSKLWRKTLSKLGFKSGKMSNIYDQRVIVSFILQWVVENILVNIIRIYNIKSVTLVGGIFYNVKLNKSIMDKVDKICVCPLAGDQGAGLGVYNKKMKNLVIRDLCIGKRDLSNFESTSEYVSVVKSDLEATTLITKYIKDGLIVNVIRGNMEFGPRALGNTSTLMKPTSENVQYINMCNGRSTIMPCAPITIDIDQFKDYSKVIRTLDHMILTLEYSYKPEDNLRGAAHRHPIDNYYTGRPQIINEDHYLYPVLFEFGTLVNTSFNVHGQPIIYSIEQLNFAIKYQQKNDVDNILRTIIVSNKN